MLSETAALRLGTTVAKAAGQVWLGGRQREQERSLPLEELVRVRVPGIRIQREVRQQFEQITNSVFDRLEPFLQHAFQRLDEGGRQAVIDAVSDTFARADLSDEAILTANAHPVELMRQITGSVSGPVGLNAAETRLYERLFAECVEYYVHIVRSLPVFEERAAAELLTRTATLGAEVAQILERLPDRSLFAPDGTDQDAAFRRTYLELVSRDLDEVELFRRTSDQASSPRVRLSVAYVSLRTTGGESRGRRTPRSMPLLRPDMSYWEGRGRGSSGMRVETALSGAPRALLRGEAGSGKTTLLRWLAVTAARGAFKDDLADWNGLTPVFVKLREYSGRKLPGPEAMLDGVAGHITGIMPRGWVERQLDGGKVLLLIDGVDELLDRERRAVREWLRKLLGQYAGVRVVVTSRPAAAGAEWLSGEDFAVLHLDRMTPPDLTAFVRQWHQAVRELGGKLPCAVEELPHYEQSLLTSLKDRAHLQSLAGTPLLAAMLCAMHLNRGRQLPRDRMELYRNALHTLVHDRDADRNVPSAVGSGLSLSDKLVILRDLAWRLSDNSHVEIAQERAAGYVAAKLKAMRHLDPLEGNQVLEELRHRSGILRSPAEGRLDFVHRTFQEYLAAEEAAEEDRIGNLTGRAHLDGWRETIVMAAGHANARQREELLAGILDRAEAEPRHARTLRLLAAACQETLNSVSDGLSRRLDESVTTLLPARRKTDPPALAAVGTGLLRFLPQSLDQLTEKAAAQTVRTVALIGGEESLNRLAQYVGDERGAVVEELISAWDYFDADAYAEKVLSQLPLDGELVPLSHSGQVQAARRLSSLKRIQMSQSNGRELEFLAEFSSLEHLTGVLIEDIDLSVLRRHAGLKELLLFGSSSLSSISTLADLTELRRLLLPMNDDMDLRVLSSLPELEALGLHDLEEKDLSALNTLTRPSILCLMGDARRTSPCLTDLSGMTGLEKLALSGIDADSWFGKLENVPSSLTVLYCLESVIPGSGRAFGLFENLETVILSDCHAPDGSPVEAMDIPGVSVLVE